MNKKRTVALFVVSLMLISFIVFPLSGCMNVYAGNTSDTQVFLNLGYLKPQLKIYKNGDLYYSFGGKVADKALAVHTLDNFYRSILPTNPGEPTIKGSYAYSLSGYKRMNYGNGYCYAKFNSNLDFNSPRGFTTRVTVTNTTSHTAWLGTVPQYNADDLTLSDAFTWNGLSGISISASGGGFTVSGHTASWHHTSHNAWYDTHVFGGLTGSGALTNVNESSAGDFYFNSTHTSITVTAYNSMGV